MQVDSIVSVKGFGDFVIACYSLRRIRGPSVHGRDLEVVAGQHLGDLARALGIQSRVRILPSGSICPPAFDARKSGILRAAKSLLELRRIFQALPRDGVLLFDRVSLRENLLSFPLRRRGLVSAQNVYMAFETTLRSMGFELHGTAPPDRSATSTRTQVAIFPESRIADKCVPAETMSRLVEELSAAGLSSEIITMGDEPMDFPARIMPRRIERTFESLISTVLSCDLVVSADSLPAHLAEYYGVPSFVVSPRPNAYWLPFSAFQTEAWCLFDEPKGLSAWLTRHFRRRSLSTCES